MIDFSTVTDIMLGNQQVTQIEDSLGNVLWSSAPAPAPTAEYFYVEDLSGAANTLSITKYKSTAPTIEVFYSTDQTNWTSMGSTSTTAITATVPANSKLYLKATANSWGYSSKYNYINCSGNYQVGGHIMSLLYDDNFENAVFTSNNQKAFQYLFDYDTKIINANSLILPSNTIDNCYTCLFNHCDHLETAPILPAMTMTPNCYSSIFNGCSSLQTAPQLPATTLAQNCYQQAFYDCRNLRSAPVLPATTLVQSCYYQLFRNCSYINEIITYASDISATNCLYQWLVNTSSTGDFYNLGNPAPTYPSDTSGIPSGWTEHTSL